MADKERKEKIIEIYEKGKPIAHFEEVNSQEYISSKESSKYEVKKKFLENVRYFAERRNINIGTIEKEAGLSTGYISRLEKQDNTTNIGIDLAKKIAEILSTSIDLLIRGDFDAISDNEKYMIDFVDKLVQSTIDNDIDWTKYTPKELHSDYTGYILMGNKYDDNLGENTFGYVSHFLDSNTHVTLSGDLFEAVLYEDTNIIISQVSFLERDPFSENEPKLLKGLEFYMRAKRNTLIPLCLTTQVSDELRNELEILYRTIIDKHGNVTLNSFAKNIIDEFMNDKETIEDLPF